MIKEKDGYVYVYDRKLAYGLCWLLKIKPYIITDDIEGTNWRFIKNAKFKRAISYLNAFED